MLSNVFIGFFKTKVSDLLFLTFPYQIYSIVSIGDIILLTVLLSTLKSWQALTQKN